MRNLGLFISVSETYRERFVSLGLLPLSYCHEYLDLAFFFKAVNLLINVSNDVHPNVISQTRSTRSSSGKKLPFAQLNAKLLLTNDPFSFEQLEHETLYLPL